MKHQMNVLFHFMIKLVRIKVVTITDALLSLLTTKIE